MTLYEIKKIFSSKGSKITLLLLSAVVIFCCWTATHNWDTKWVDENGETKTGFTAVRNLRASRKEWAGPLDTERLTAVIQENQRILATAEYHSDDIREKDIAYGWRQGIADIRFVLNDFFADSYHSYNYYRADSIRPGELPGMYENRITLLQEWLEDETGSAANRFTEAEKKWLIDQYRAMETPMLYDYYEGWEQAAQGSLLLLFSCSVLLGYLCAGIFSNEFKWKADAVYFSSQHGRKEATKAKIMAGFLTVTVLYWAAVIIYSLFVLIFMGFDGWNCPIQLEQWDSFFNITMMERYLLSILSGYIGNLFFAFLIMWVSAKTRSSLFPVTIPFVLYFLPNFILQYVEDTPFAKILGLLTDRLLQTSNVMDKFDLYSIGDWVVPSVPLVLILYSIASVLLVPMMYKEFSRKETIA